MSRGGDSGNLRRRRDGGDNLRRPEFLSLAGCGQQRPYCGERRMLNHSNRHSHETVAIASGELFCARGAS